MPSKPTPPKVDQRCPRCDRELMVASVGHGSARGLLLACPELYCDYTWAVSPRELAFISKRRSSAERDVAVKRAAG